MGWWNEKGTWHRFRFLPDYWVPKESKPRHGCQRGGGPGKRRIEQKKMSIFVPNTFSSWNIQSWRACWAKSSGSNQQRRNSIVATRPWPSPLPASSSYSWSYSYTCWCPSIHTHMMISGQLGHMSTGLAKKKVAMLWASSALMPGWFLGKHTRSKIIKFACYNDKWLQEGIHVIYVYQIYFTNAFSIIAYLLDLS